MKRGILALLLLCASFACRAEDADELPDNKKLPKCDKVEILRLEGSVLEDANGHPRYKPEQRPTGIESYYVEYAGGYWTRLYGTKTLRGDDAERIATYWRALAPEPPPPGVGRGLAKCHVPGFAFRFYSGDKLFAESTVCWMCENLGIHIGGKFAARSFDPKALPAKDLLAAGQKFFPDVKTEFDK